MVKGVSEFKTTVATINNFPTQEVYAGNAVVYFCESHNKSVYERYYIRSTTNLLHRYAAKLTDCEKYELRTGYLSRWNYMPKDIDEISYEEIQQSIKFGYEEEKDWLKRCEPDLPETFIVKDWKDCISEKENRHYQECKEFINQELGKNAVFNDAFKSSVESYAKKHKSNLKNGWNYVLEEVAWVFSLPLVHPNKYIYLIHVGKANPAIKELFKGFPNMNKTVKWLRPHIGQAIFRNDVDFLMYYNANRNVGCSYAMDNRNIVSPFINAPAREKNSPFGIESTERALLQSIIGKLPCHIYWLNRDNVYLGCNDSQAKILELKSRDKITGKTNFDFHDTDTAKRLNDINEFVMSTGKPHEVEESGYVLGELKQCLTNKIPLFNSLGKVIGLLGISIDITERKRAEELQKKLEIQEELYRIAKKVAHDINSPISALKIVAYMSANKLTEKEKRMLEMSITSIESIAETLLGEYKTIKRAEQGEIVEVVDRSAEKYISAYCGLADVIESKQYQFKDSNVTFNYIPDENNKYAFLGGDFSGFSRMMHNLINNAVEA